MFACILVCVTELTENLNWVGKGFSDSGREKWRDWECHGRGGYIKQVTVSEEEDEQKLQVINDWMKT